MTNIDIIGGQFSSNKPYLLRALYEWILDNDATPYLLVDTTRKDVQVPRQHVKDGQIVLNASPGAVQGWFVDNYAISFSARFSGKAQSIYIPMKSLLAIYAQENGLGMAFPEEPDDALEKQQELQENVLKTAEDAHDKVKKIKTGIKKKSSHLKVIK